MLDPFQLPFMQRAALEIVLLAPLAGLLGAQIVLRHLAFFTHGVGAAAFPGLVVAGPGRHSPRPRRARRRRRVRRAARAAGAQTRYRLRRGDGLLLVIALAVGIILASDVFESGSGVDQLLFGSLLAVGADELWSTAAALLVAFAAAAVARRAWIASGFDGTSTRSLGIDARLADWLLVGSITVAVVVSLDAIGALLVSSLLVIPAAIARLFARSVTRARGRRHPDRPRPGHGRPAHRLRVRPAARSDDRGARWSSFRGLPGAPQPRRAPPPRGRRDERPADPHRRPQRRLRRRRARHRRRRVRGAARPDGRRARSERRRQDDPLSRPARRGAASPRRSARLGLDRLRAADRARPPRLPGQRPRRRPDGHLRIGRAGSGESGASSEARPPRRWSGSASPIARRARSESSRAGSASAS